MKFWSRFQGQVTTGRRTGKTRRANLSRRIVEKSQLIKEYLDALCERCLANNEVTSVPRYSPSRIICVGFRQADRIDPLSNTS